MRSRAGGNTLKPCVSPFSRTRLFTEAYTQAMQEAGDTRDLQSWAKVVQIAKGQSQRGSKHHVPKQQTTSSPNFNSDHVPLKSSKVTSLLLLLSILQASSLLPVTHLLPRGLLGTRRPGFSILRGPWPPNERWVLGLGPGWRETNTFITGLTASRTIMSRKKHLWEKNQEGGYQGMFWSLYTDGPPVQGRCLANLG